MMPVENPSERPPVEWPGSSFRQGTAFYPEARRVAVPKNVRRCGALAPEARRATPSAICGPASCRWLSYFLLSAIGLLSLAVAAAQKKPPAHPIDLNTATVEQLQELPGIGPSTAKAIIQFREKSGPLKRVEDLLAIHGISKARLEKLRPYVTVTPPPQK
jgi:competence ComEA-like helix-hairpin-helix protein